MIEYLLCLTKRVLLFITPFLILPSCTDLVEIDLPVSDDYPLVIDALFLVEDTTGVSFLRLTKAYGSDIEDQDKGTELLFNQPYILNNPVSNAVVSIQSSEDEYFQLQEGIQYDGWYWIANSKLKEGISYKIIVETENEIYESTFQKMNSKAKVDSVAVLSNEYLTENGLGFFPLANEWPYYLSSAFTISEDLDLFYTWKYSGVDISNFRTFSEQRYAGGAKITLEVNWFDVRPIGDGDMSQLSINENFYNYINDIQNSLADQTPFSTPIATPVNNLHCVSDNSKQVLGFFEVANLVNKRYRVPSSF